MLPLVLASHTVQPLAGSHLLSLYMMPQWYQNLLVTRPSLQGLLEVGVWALLPFQILLLCLALGQSWAWGLLPLLSLQLPRHPHS